MHAVLLGVVVSLLAACGQSAVPDPAPAEPQRMAEAPPADAPPVPASPAPNPAPAAPTAPAIPPSVDPATLPEAARPLATLAQLLASERIQSLGRSDQLLEPRTPPLPVVSGTWVQDAEQTWLCGEEAGREAHCVTLPGHDAAGTIRANQTQQYFVIASWTRAGRTTEVKMDASGAAQATQRPEGTLSTTGTPLPAPATRPPPRVLTGLRGIDAVQLVDVLYASAGGHLTACRMTGSPVCTPPIAVEALARGRSELDRLGLRRIGHALTFGFTVVGENGAMQFGTGDLFVRASFEPPSLVLLATFVGEAGSSTRGARDSTNDLFISALSRLHDDCLEIERSRVSLTNDALGDRELPGPRLRRAPNEVPATGVDPLRVTMEGSWTVRPEGGLRRRNGRCPVEGSAR